ncbi:MAG: hypothetical protein WC319_06665 [Candidatus Paceibacterota bacterium]|jgi:hypothetical protein
MDNINNLETYAKILVGITGAIATFGKIRESFTSIKRKQELKLDLEILDKLKNNGNIQTENIEEKINSSLKKAFENKSENLTTFFIGIAVFVGFGFWTVDILNQSQSFSGWIILTLLLSLVGLSMIFGNNEKKIEKGIFYQIGFYDKSNFRFGIIITLFTGFLTPILILKLNGFSFWQFLSGLFFLIGIGSLIRNIKRIK